MCVFPDRTEILYRWREAAVVANRRDLGRCHWRLRLGPRVHIARINHDPTATLRGNFVVHPVTHLQNLRCPKWTLPGLCMLRCEGIDVHGRTTRHGACMQKAFSGPVWIEPNSFKSSWLHLCRVVVRLSDAAGGYHQDPNAGSHWSRIESRVLDLLERLVSAHVFESTPCTSAYGVFVHVFKRFWLAICIIYFIFPPFASGTIGRARLHVSN